MLAYGDEDWAAVLRLAPAAIHALPNDGDAILHLQVELAQAEALWREGRAAEAMPLYAHVVRECPGLIPLMEASLPLRPAVGFPSGLPCTRTDLRGFRLVGVAVETSGTAPGIRYSLATADGVVLREGELPRLPEVGLSAWEGLFVGPMRLAETEKAGLDGRAGGIVKN